MYSTGQGVAQDDQQAVAWLRKAAERGHAEAQFSLGQMYSNGRGVAQDSEVAASWYQKAGQQGETRALEQLKILGVGTRESANLDALARLAEFTLSWKSSE